MMENVGSHNFLYSCVDEKKRSNEQFIAEHAFGIILSGESHFHTEEGMKTYAEGTIALMKRNLLLKSIKVPPANGPFKSINIFFTQDFLHRYAVEQSITPTVYKGGPIILLNGNEFIKSFFDSLELYFDDPNRMSATMSELKTREGLELLLQSDKRCKDLLFDFSEPFKIDLDAFMNKNYVYNVSLAQFAKLTGRSLATFKRDFQKTFGSPPEKWLQQKRLEHAHFLISEKKQTPSDAYLEVGFENLSHFSTSFKKFYGYNPSSLR